MDEEILIRNGQKAFNSVQDMRKIVLIRVFSGGISSHPTFSFNSALQSVISKWSLLLDIRSESMTVMGLRESNWSEKQFIDWLLESDIHMVITHPHQGTETFLWSIDDLYNEINRLHKHIGFPSRDQLACPIFTQNKFGYLEPMRKYYMTNPTMKIVVR
jgi:hypothetical protein